MYTYDSRTIDSTGAFLVGELERLDPILHMPLVDYKWGRDIDLREDVTIGDELTSYTNSTFAMPGGINSNGINYAAKNTNDAPGIQVDISKTANPLHLVIYPLSYSIIELESSMRVQRPIDVDKFNGLNLKWQMDIDQTVYIGDSTIGKYGLVNSPLVTNGFVDDCGTGNTTQWIYKTPTQILADVNALLNAAYAQAGYALCPNKILLPPTQYGYIASTPVTSAGVESILEFIIKNNISNRYNGSPLEILPCKWLVGRGTAAGSPLTATDRMVAYTQAPDRVRFPMVPLQKTPLEYRSIYHITTYFGKLGCVEWVYPEAGYYADGI